MNADKTDKILNESINYFNTHGIPNYSRVKKIIHPKLIIDKERKRLGVSNPNITLQQLGLDTIQKQDNLYNKMDNRQLRITSICAENLKKVKLGIKSDT